MLASINRRWTAAADEYRHARAVMTASQIATSPVRVIFFIAAAKAVQVVGRGRVQAVIAPMFEARQLARDLTSAVRNDAGSKLQTVRQKIALHL
jgi:hypothetical protein